MLESLRAMNEKMDRIHTSMKQVLDNAVDSTRLVDTWIGMFGGQRD